MLKREGIRDPFILTDKNKGCYYMYGTTNLYTDALRIAVYKTVDPKHFDEPRVTFFGTEIGFWADRNYRAPDLLPYYAVFSPRSATKFIFTQRSSYAKSNNRRHRRRSRWH